jgi:hypothetical protein
VLADELDGLSTDALARLLHRRRADVLATLRRDRRFEHVGNGSASRWRLRVEARSSERDGRGRDRDGRRGDPRPDHNGVLRPSVLGHLEALEREMVALRVRVAKLERKA